MKIWRVRRDAVKEVSQRAVPAAIAALLSSVVEESSRSFAIEQRLQVLARVMSTLFRHYRTTAAIPTGSANASVGLR